ncbi:hypothetical protein TNCV_1058651, partial [Trichonephila clavipes]
MESSALPLRSPSDVRVADLSCGQNKESGRLSITNIRKRRYSY